MAKLYPTQKFEIRKGMKPKKETISFLLNYSKVLSFITVGKMKVELIAN